MRLCEPHLDPETSLNHRGIDRSGLGDEIDDALGEANIRINDRGAEVLREREQLGTVFDTLSSKAPTLVWFCIQHGESGGSAT